MNKLLRPSVDSIIIYRLLPCHHPTNPNRLWTGKVIKVYRDNTAVLVESLEPAYFQETEIVTKEQVIRVEEKT